MVTTSTTAAASTTTITNNGNMLLYNNNNVSNNGATSAVSNDRESGSSGSITTSCNTAATLEQYRLQLYNYALNMERLRGPPYTAAAAMAAAAAYASTTTVSTTTINGPAIHGATYTATGQGPPPPPSSYLCATTAGSLIAATSHMGRSAGALAQCPTGNRLALASMSLFPQRIFQPEEPKPQHSYIGLIAMAILSSAETKLVLSDIYQYILDNYPYFRTRGPGWRNSIRHNLSLNDCFIKSGRSANGKGHYWAIHPANMEDFRKGDFRRRKAQRKVRKHMGLAVDDNGTDSPSPPPAMDLTSPSPPSFQHVVMGGTTITPLATAAQHLAAHSFGWRFTQQHHRHHPQHPQAATHAASGTSASYMGQIFTYRPQHYAAAAVAAAALCHSSNSQQHQQQQLIAPTSHHQQHPADTSMLQPTTLISSQPSIAATNVQTNVISELFSQKRKRQFDVASLLAPDHFNKREQHQQQYIRRHTFEGAMDEMRPSASCNDDILDANETTNDLDIEDIDVVDASEDEEIEADYDEHDDEVDSNSNSRSRSRSHSASHSHNDDEEAEYIRRFNTEHALRIKPNHCKISKINTTEDETVIRVHDYAPDDGDEEPNEREEGDEHDNTNEENESEFSAAIHNNNQEETHLSSDYKTISHILKASSSPLRTQSPLKHTTRLNSPPQPAPHILDSNQLLEYTNDIQHSHPHSQQLPINAEAHNLFGRYYGTYMAAAAAARINSSMPSVSTVVLNTE